MKARGYYPEKDMRTQGVRPASLSVDVAKGEFVILAPNSVLALNMSVDYQAGETDAWLVQRAYGVEVDAVAAVYSVGDAVYATTANPNTPVSKTLTAETFVGHVIIAKTLSATGRIVIDFNGGKNKP